MRSFAHDIGDSKPGDTGESKGSFHERARQETYVLIDGKVVSTEEYKRTSTGELEQRSNQSLSQGSTTPYNPDGKVSQSEAEGKIVQLTPDSKGGTRDTLAHFKNHQVHIEGGTPGETINVRLESGPGFLIGRRIELRE